MSSSSGLKTNIAVNVVLLLFCAMALTAFVTLNLVERILVMERIDRGRALITHFEHNGKNMFEEQGGIKAPDVKRMLEEAGVSRAIVLVPEKGDRQFFGTDELWDDRLESMARRAAVSGRVQEDHTGQGFGLFWTQPQNILYAAPLNLGAGLRSGAGIHISLAPLFGKVRNAQRLIFIYILINTLIMTLAGVHQIGKVAVKPLKRILRRAEAFTGETGEFTFEEKSGNEFSKLSMALNTMLGRISAHKNELEKTVKSLESANAELKKAQDEVVRAEKLASVGRLSSGIAHEIGNPLGIVSGYLELLKNSDIPNEQKQEFIVRAEKELARIDRIIKQLLGYARSKPSRFAVVSVHEIIRDVAEMMKVQPLMAGICFDLDLGASTDTITGDSDHLRQILLNLAINARDAIAATEKKDGCLLIETRDDEKMKNQEGKGGPFIRISVKDNGTGISGKNLETIFDPFFTTKEPGKGTGLGLSVCDTMVRDMGGQIDVTSEEGKGTEFALVFPLATDETEIEHNRET